MEKPRVHPFFDPERVPQSHTPIMGGSFIPLEAFQTILLPHPFSMSLLAYARAKEEKNSSILHSTKGDPPLPSSDIPQSPYLQEHKKDLQAIINFTYDEFLDLWRDFDVVFQGKRTRGPRPKLDSLDSLFVSLPLQPVPPP